MTLKPCLSRLTACKCSIPFVFHNEYCDPLHWITIVSIAGLRRESVELIVPDRVPSLYLLMSFSTEVAPGISRSVAEAYYSNHPLT